MLIFAEALSAGLRSIYQNKNEVNIVKKIVEVVNSGGEFSGKDFKVSKSVFFIHGCKPNVTFRYYGEEKTRELGDAFFIFCVKCGNKKYLEKMTITQFKKSKGASWLPKDDSSKEQLFLLSRFPPFRFNLKNASSNWYSLRNTSGVLGTHGLLHSPGDFVLMSSMLLESLANNNQKIDLLKIYQLANSFSTCFYEYCNIHCALYNARWCFYDFCPDYFSKIFDHLNLSRSYQVCLNTYDFLWKYLTGCFGEPTFLWFVPEHVYSANREFLHQFLNLLKNVIKKLDQNTDAMEFLHDFLTTPYSGVQPPEVDDYEVADDDFGEIGVIIVVFDILDE